MLSIGEYVKLLLKKRGLTVQDLANLMTEEERKHGSTTTVYYTHIQVELKNGRLGLERARQIEIALRLPKFQLINMINPDLSSKQLKKLDNIYKKESKNRLENEQI